MRPWMPRGRFAIDNTAVRVSTTGPDASDRKTGKIKLVATNFNDDEIEFSYFGSDSFYIEVDHGPIQNIDDVEIVLPLLTRMIGQQSMTSCGIISLSNGVDDTCQDCRIRIGVVTPPTDRDESTPLSSRISVLGISYEGSERITLADDLVSGNTFTAILDFDPVNVAGTNEDDDGEGIIDHRDIVVVNMEKLTSTPTITNVEGRNVEFMLGSGSATDGATIDVAYALRVGANPQNAPPARRGPSPHHRGGCWFPRRLHLGQRPGNRGC